MYYLVYLTTNLTNNKIYVGVRTTVKLDDGYLGSGTTIKKAIKKYGKENFKRTILYFCLSSEEAYEWERKIVDFSFLCREDVYNIKPGGERPVTDIIRFKISKKLTEHTKTEEHKRNISKSWIERNKNANKDKRSESAKRGAQTRREQSKFILEQLVKIFEIQFLVSLCVKYKKVGKGYKKYYNKETNEVINRMPCDDIPEGFVLGDRPKTKEHIDKILLNGNEKFKNSGKQTNEHIEKRSKAKKENNRNKKLQELID